MLTPLDLNNNNFSKGFRGYDTEEVDEFFAKVAKDFERLYQDNVELKDAVERVSAKLEYYQQMESTMQNTLVIAQETADEVEVAKMKVTTEDLCKKMSSQAKDEASDVLAQARAEAQKRTSEADARYRPMIAEAE